MGYFGVKNFQVFKNGSKLVLPDRTGIRHVKNQIFIHYLGQDEGRDPVKNPRFRDCSFVSAALEILP